MCFSAAASFTTAALTGAAGALAMTRVNTPRELPLAAMPLLFAVQQTIEGLLWLNLRSAEGALTDGLTFLFLMFAQVLWPIWAPLAVLLVEPSRMRRRLMWPWLALGAGVSAYLLWGLLNGPHGARLVHDHIAYGTEQPHPTLIALAYLAATSVPLLLSTRRTIVALGAVVLVGSATAFVFYWSAFQSVWCYFAAAGSLVLLGHFHVARRHHLRLAAA